MNDFQKKKEELYNLLQIAAECKLVGSNKNKIDDLVVVAAIDLVRSAANSGILEIEDADEKKTEMPCNGHCAENKDTTVESFQRQFTI